MLGILLCAAPLLAAPAQGSPLDERAALRELLSHEAGAARGGVVPLPLPEPRPPARASAASSGELALLARSPGPERVLVGVHAHADLAGVASEVRRLGAQPELFPEIGVLAARVLSGAALVAALRDDLRVDYIERDRILRTAADPFDTIDPRTQIKYTWFYDAVRAAEALAAAGGGSSRTVAVIDTGIDVNHPELAGRIARTYDTRSGGSAVTDHVGHGTFVSGLISAIDGNGIGGKGVAGNTRLVAVRGSRDGTFTVSDLIRGVAFSVRSGADVLNMSLAGRSFTRSQGRVLRAAFYNDVLPVAASGNNAQAGNPLEFPAAALGGERGRPGIGLSVAATNQDGLVAAFSNHNRYVSLAAPGAGPSGCVGLFSTLPANLGTAWDDPELSCSLIFPAAEARYGYAEGTSFAAPVVAGIAAVVWQVERRLASEQVAEVLTRSARQTSGRDWNEFTGRGIVDGAAATALARTYDVTAPRGRAAARRLGGAVSVRLRRSRDRTEPGRELAGKVTYGVIVSRNGGRSFSAAGRRKRKPFTSTVALSGSRPNVLAATTCDGNGNCSVKRLGRYRP